MHCSAEIKTAYAGICQVSCTAMYLLHCTVLAGRPSAKSTLFPVLFDLLTTTVLPPNETVQFRPSRDKDRLRWWCWYQRLSISAIYLCGLIPSERWAGNVRCAIRLTACRSVGQSVFLCPSTGLCLSTGLSVNRSVCLSIGLSVCLSACLFVCLSIGLSSTGLSVGLSVCLSVYRPACLSIGQSACPVVCLSNGLSVCQSVCLPVCLAACLSVYPPRLTTNHVLVVGGSVGQSSSVIAFPFA